MADPTEDTRSTNVDENASIEAEVKAEAKEVLSSAGPTATESTIDETKSEETTTSSNGIGQKDSHVNFSLKNDVGKEAEADKDGKKVEVKNPLEKVKEVDVKAEKQDDHQVKGEGRRGGHSSNGVRSRFDNLEESDDQDEIRRQVEFYFSDSNLPIDPYLFKLVGGHANNFIPLKVITDFKRMRHFQPYSTVLEAVTKSDFLEVNDKEEIKRKVPLSDRFTTDCEENKKIQHSASMDKSIYAKGFGDEIETTQIDIEQFFQPFNAKVVRLRRSNEMSFKGSVFVEFHDEAAQKEFLVHDPKPKWENKELDIMSKRAYVELKHDGIVAGLVKPRSPARGNNGYNNGRGNNNARGGGRGWDRQRGSRQNDSRDSSNRDDWNKRRERDNDRSNNRRGGKRDNDRDNNRGKRDRGSKPHRGNGRERKDRDNRRDEHSPSGSGKEDHDHDKEMTTAARQEKTEGIAKRLGASDGENGTKRPREDGDEGRDGGESKKVKEAETTEKTAAEA